METVTELTVWADASVLAEAKHLFSHFEAAIRPIPKTCHSKDVPKSKVSVVYLKHSEPKKDHISFLECFKSPKVGQEDPRSQGTSAIDGRVCDRSERAGVAADTSTGNSEPNSYSSNRGWEDARHHR
jgi:hypothetical protein